MPNVMGVLRAEIRRLARKETKQELAALRKQVTSIRRRMAESRRKIRDLEHQTKAATRSSPPRAAAEETGKQVRFSPAWVKKHRSKLGMSRQLYAKLVGVSAQTIMGWEAGRTRPRRGALRSWRSIREKGVRELRAMLAGGTARRGRRAAKRVMKKGRKARRRAASPAARRRPVRGRAVRRRAPRRKAAPRRAVRRRVRARSKKK